MPKLLLLTQNCLLDLISGTSFRSFAMLSALTSADRAARAKTITYCAGGREFPQGGRCVPKNWRTFLSRMPVLAPTRPDERNADPT